MGGMQRQPTVCCECCGHRATRAWMPCSAGSATSRQCQAPGAARSGSAAPPWLRGLAWPRSAAARRAPAESGVGNALTCRAPERPGSLPTRRSPPYGASAHRYALCLCATRREGAVLRWQRCSCWRSGSLLRGWLWLPPSPTPPAQPCGPARRPPQPISRRQGTAGPPLAGPGWQRPEGPSRGPP